MVAWIVGLGGVAVLVGVPLSYGSYRLFARLLGQSHKPLTFVPGSTGHTGPLFGLVERLGFATWIGFEGSATGLPLGAMIAWMALFGATMWANYRKTNQMGQFAVSVLSKFISLLIATIAGLVCSGDIPIPGA